MMNRLQTKVITNSKTGNFYGQPIKTGALSRQLGIPISAKIPMYLLQEIKNKKIGGYVTYNSHRIKVTALLKKRVQFAINSRNWKRAR